MDQRQEWTFGTHRAWFEPPDILRAQFRGAVDVDSVRWSVGTYAGMATHQPFYLLADITGSRHTPEARKYLVENTRTEWFRGIVYIGASHEQRAVTTGFMLARMKGGGPLHEPVFVDTVEQALAWVEQHRAKSPRGP